MTVLYRWSYGEARFKITNTQFNKLKSAAKNKTWTTLKITKKNFKVKELPHELLVSLRQRIRNAFPNKIPAYIKLSKAELLKII